MTTVGDPLPSETGVERSLYSGAVPQRPGSLDLTPLESAVAQLEEALRCYGRAEQLPYGWLPRQLRAAVIQAFEFTYELAFGMLRRHLAASAPDPGRVERMTFNEIIRVALDLGLVSAELPAWRRFRKHRGTTSRTYSEARAVVVFEAVPGFLEEARYLLARLGERNPPA